MTQCDICRGRGMWISKEGAEIHCDACAGHPHHMGQCITRDDAKRISEDGP